MADEVAALVEERATLIDWVLERLDDLKSQLNDIDIGIDNPVLPPRGFDLPIGAESALEAIGDAIFKAERVWSR
ncbi:MAG: hypothetical protein KGL39_55015 [Patescibacteria group bacterium]|nr:hypothetical protein [Patescibacteria group bacterium]